MTRILVKDLEPGRKHFIQARAISGTEYSAWSSLYEFTTISDTMPPAPCTNLTWTVEGTAFAATWAGPVTNEDGTPLLDFKDFQVKVFSPAASGTVATYYTAAARFDFPFESNLNAFGTPRAQVTIEVRARDNTGNLSTPVTATATNPPPSNVTGLTAVGISDAVALRWEPVPDTDLKHYEVRQGVAAGSENTLVYRGNATSFVFDTTASVPQYFAVVAVDVFNTPSVISAKASATPRSSMAVDTEPPKAPTNVTAVTNLHSTDPTGSTAFIDVTWTGVPDTDLQNYLVRYASSSTTTTFEYVSVPEGVTEARIHNLKSNTTYYISVSAVDYSGNSSTWTQATPYPITTAKDTTAPSTPSAPTVAANAMQIQISHSGNKAAGGPLEADTAYLEVHVSTTPSFTASASTMIGRIEFGLANVASFPIPASAATGTAQTWYSKVFAIDYSGNRSTSSSISSASVPLIASSNIQDAAITNAKINDLTADKLSAGSAFINQLNIRSSLIIDNAAGEVKSSNYAAGSAGWRLAQNTLEINDGSISARALKLQNGVNLVHPAFADFEWSPTWYSTTNSITKGGGNPTWTIATAPEVNSRFGVQCLKISRPAGVAAGTDTDVFLSANSSTYNVPFEPGLTYIASAWMMTPAGTGPKTVQLKLRTNDGAWTSFGGYVTVPDTGQWVRVSGTRTIPAGITAGVMFFGLQTQGDVYIDGLQLEVMQTSDSTPSQWKPPSFTTIDGGIIKTGSIQSTAAANGLSGQPAWSINMAGNAQFGDANVRGRLVVGDPNNPAADGVNSRIYSSNYVPGSTGWIIRSDGYAEFRNLAVNSVKVTALDSPMQNTTYAKLFDYMQDGALWLTNGLVMQKTDPGAFSANSLFEFTGPGLIIRNGTGVKPIAFDPTILYRVSARVRAYSVTPLNTNGDFEATTLTNWSTDASGSSVLTLSTAQKYAGAKSMQLASGLATGGVYRAWTPVSVKAGYNYTFSARVKSNILDAHYAAGQLGAVELRATYFTGSAQNGYLDEQIVLIPAPVDANGNVLTAPSPWFSVSATFTPPPGANSANFIIRLARFNSTVPVGTTIGWIDDVQVTTPPRIKLGVFGTDANQNIIDYDFVSDAATPTKKRAFPSNVGALSGYTAGQYMCVANNDEIQTAVASSDTVADWVTLTGYIRGRGGSGTDGSFGNPAKAPDPYNPASLNQQVAFLLPYVEFDVASGTKAQLDQFSLEAFEGGAPGKVATGASLGEKSISVEKIDGDTFDHAIRFFTGNEDERRPALIGHSIDNDMNDAAHLRILAPRLNADTDDLSSSYIGIWERNPNYIYDASFENGIPGWSGMANTSVSWREDDGYSDSTCLAITATSTPASPSTTDLHGKYAVSTLINPELIGQTITVSGVAKMGSATARNVRIRCKFLNEAGGMIAGWYNEKLTTNAAWNSFSFYTPSIVPDDCTAVEISFYWYNGAAGDVVLVDDVQLETGTKTAFRSGQASQIALNSQIVRSTGSIIVSTDTDIDLPSDILLSGDRLDAPSNPMLILQNEGGTTVLKHLNYIDSNGNRAFSSLDYYSPTGVVENGLRLYGLNDERYAGRAAIMSPNGSSFALSTRVPTGGDPAVDRFDTYVHGSLFVDGDLDWKTVSSTALTPFDAGRAFGYTKFAGMVYFRGAGTITATGGSSGTVLFNLPSAYRPKNPQYIATNGWAASAGAVTPMIIHVPTSGNVVVWAPQTTPTNITFEGMSFPINPVPDAPAPPTGDTTPPGSVSGFKITALSSGSSTGTYRLNWTNPTASDTAGVKIIWRSDRYPTVTIPTSGTRTLTTDGKIITITGSASQAKSYDHASLPVNKTIYYRVVAYDKSGNHSGYVSASRYLLASPVTVTANSSGSYRLGYGGMWRNDGDEVYQGDWTGNDNHRGLFFYGTKIYDAVNKGGIVRTPTKMTIYLKRQSSGGNYSGVPINLRGHKYQVKPSGDPIGNMTNEASAGDKVVYLSPGEGATVTVPSSWYNNFVASTAADRLEGLGVYGTTNGEYAILYGRGNSSSNGKVTIYHKG